MYARSWMSIELTVSGARFFGKPSHLLLCRILLPFSQGQFIQPGEDVGSEVAATAGTEDSIRLEI